MKLQKPKLIKKAVKIIADNRGYVSGNDLDKLFKIRKNFLFSPKYKLFSVTKKKNTFRGFHYQKKPKPQNKLIIIYSGKIKDFIIPIENPEYKKIKSYELSEGDALFIPSNYAHAFHSLSKDVIMEYYMDEKFYPSMYTGIYGLDILKANSNYKDIIISLKDKKLPKLIKNNNHII
jgi:dTDP-4-dehydrorhamnose 3,5-epimerase